MRKVVLRMRKLVFVTLISVMLIVGGTASALPVIVDVPSTAAIWLARRGLSNSMREPLFKVDSLITAPPMKYRGWSTPGRSSTHRFSGYWRCARLQA